MPRVPQPEIAPYGTWKSPISADLIVKKSIAFDNVFTDPGTSKIYHTEIRPEEGGRSVIVDTVEGTDVFGPEWNARTGVQEYGGAAAIAHGGVFYFSNYKDGRVYAIEKGGEPLPITSENKNHRFGNFCVHPTHSNLIVAILEDHTHPAHADVVTILVVIDKLDSSISTLVSGADFYSSATFNFDGSRLAWIQWHHPDMPWEGAELFVASVAITDGHIKLSDTLKIAGQKQSVSAAQPKWLTQDTLLFTCDSSRYQNPYICSLGKPGEKTVELILRDNLPQDFGEPGWVLGDSCYAILDEDRAVFTAFKNGQSKLYAITISQKSLTELVCPYTYIKNVRKLTADSILFVARKADEPQAIVQCTLGASEEPDYATLRSTPSVSEGDAQASEILISLPEPITFVVPPRNEPLHVVFYPPKNLAYVGPQGEKPPCVIHVHGGPTGMEPQSLSWRKQYYTSRGWAWVDVNYGGSSGYGRDYIDRLAGGWGVVDVQDCVQAVRQLSTPPHALIDPARVVIRGGSAGGFTVLAAMCAAPEVFAAGTSSYGISDLRKLAEDTHKFESRYLEKLIGGTLHEVPHIYKERSPIFNADKIRSPLLILQGSIDAVVPPAQAEDIVKIIRENNGTVEYILFEGEGHGWRQAKNLKMALEKEFSFYMDVMGLSQV